MPEVLSSWARYESNPSFLLGFHGCDKKVGEAILSGSERHLKPSENSYDWLGHGIYFWESSPERAMEFAQERASGRNVSKGNITEPFVVGAVIDPKHCLNLMDRSALLKVKKAYDLMEIFLKSIDMEMPKNGSGLRTRNLDCAVFQFLHDFRKEQNPSPKPYDSVRGLFFEGDDLYPDAGIKAKDHIQICVRSEDSILGYFRPIVD